MGRIKQVYLKRIAGELLENYANIFNLEFENNKKRVHELTTVGSKSVRNKIAGFITRVKKQQMQEIQ